MAGVFLEAKELRDLIIRYPDLPMVLRVDYEPKDWCWGLHTCCKAVWAELGEVLDCEQPRESTCFYTSRADLTGDLSEQYQEQGLDGWELKLEETIREYEGHWVPCIIVYCEGLEDDDEGDLS